MYSKEELSSKKYSDLLKILKKLGIKGGRQKTERVIKLILENQNAAHEDSSKSILEASLTESKLMDDETGTRMTSNSSLVNNNNTENVIDIQPSQNSVDIQPSQNSVSKTKRNSNVNKRLTRSSILNLEELIDEVDKKVKKDHQMAKSLDHEEEKLINDESHENSSLSLSRSNTFVLEDGLLDDSLTASFNSNISLNRSKTFILDEDKKPKKKSMPVSPEKKMDLSCSEVQTAEDIEKIENGSEDSSFTSPSIIGSRIKKGTRRSLRGQLLESKMYLNDILPTLPTISSESESITSDSNSSSKDNQSATTFNEDNITVPKTFDFGKKFNSGEKSSGIPRFISYARKLRMPDFNRIHENAFKKMEALDEYIERKQVKTKSIIDALTGDKKELGINTEQKKPEVSKSNYSAIRRRITAQTPGSVSKRRSSTLGIQNSSSPAGDAMAKDPAQKSVSCLRPCTVPKLVKENLPPKNISTNLWNKPQTDLGTPGSFQRRKSYVPTPPRSSLASRKLTSEQAQGNALTGGFVHALKKTGENKGFSRIETMKRAANRKPNVKSSAEIRASEKVFIKGVRTNRRFELQMANRGIGPI